MGSDRRDARETARFAVEALAIAAGRDCCSLLVDAASTCRPGREPIDSTMPHIVDRPQGSAYYCVESVDDS
jgi:hypothetical protein